MTDLSVIEEPQVREVPGSDATPAVDPAATGDNEDSPSSQSGTSAARKPSGVQKRIDELTRDKGDIARDRDYWRELALKGQKDPGGKPAGDSAPKTGEPKPGDFDKYEEYLSAVVDYRVESKLAKQHTERTQERDRERAAKGTEKLDANVKVARDFYQDFDEVFNSVVADTSFPISPTMGEVITESDLGPDLVYWLGNNLDEAKRIYKLNPVQQAREMGRIEAGIKRPDKKTVTKADDPPKVLGGGGDTGTKDPSKMSMDEYVKWRGAGGGST